MKPCPDCGGEVVGLWPGGRCYGCWLIERDHDHDCYATADNLPASPKAEPWNGDET